MITWEITRVEWGGDRYTQTDVFPISYTCNVCKNKWGGLGRLNKNSGIKLDLTLNGLKNMNKALEIMSNHW